jgi:hypothetical protein
MAPTPRSIRPRHRPARRPQSARPPTSPTLTVQPIRSTAIRARSVLPAKSLSVIEFRLSVTPPCRLFAGPGARSSLLALYADLPFMAYLSWLPMTCAGRSRVQGRHGRVARMSLLGSTGWSCLAPRTAGVIGFVGEAIGRPSPGLLVSRSGSPSTGSPASVSVCPMAEPGVMMALEIKPTQCRGCRGGAHRCSLVELRFVKVVGLSICGTTALAAMPGSAASRSGHGRAARGG